MVLTYKDIEYTLTQSNRKTVGLSIERDGRVAVRVPAGVAQEQVEEILEQKRSWIYQGLTEWETLNSPRIKREFVNGESFWYLGRTYRLRLVMEQGEPLQLKQGYFCLKATPAGVAPANGRELFKEFYRAKGYKRLPGRVAYYERQMGVQAHEVRVLELQNRWASCSAKGNLNFNWKLLMAPPLVIDYVVVHELAHLKEPNHSAGFWREVEKVMPNYRPGEEWLRQYGAQLVV